MSRRERQKRRKSHRGHPVRRGFAVSFLVVGAAGLLVALAVVGWVVAVAESAPDISTLKPQDEGTNSVVYAADGSRLGFIQSDILREPVKDSALPRVLKQATVAIEDRRFYKHKGVDYQGIVRAGVANITSKGKAVQGGSTLTMQLMRNLYIPKQRNEKTLSRKIKEAKLAEQYERKHTKDEILSAYLNNVPYATVGGQTTVGAQAASRTLFNKPVQKLTLTQAALLAGLPQAPSQYNPFLDKSAALNRRNEVLNAMVKAGVLSAERAGRAAAAPLGVQLNRYFTARREQYFFDYVKDELNRRYGVNTVRAGGFRIHTTIDLKLQKQARQAIAGQLNQVGDPSSAIVSIDPRNGYIRAMASSATYGKTRFNYATQAHRQPGSTFKVMVLMAALRKGIDPESTSYTSRPLQPGWLKGYPTYKVETYAKSYNGSMNLVQATLKSDNTVYAQLDADVTPEAVRQTAYDMGITSKLEALPAEGLGGLGVGVSPLEMANAYATVASGGYRNKPIAITRVDHPSGEVDNLGKPRRVKAFDTAVTAKATDILTKNVQSGTGTAASYGCPAAGKTGTTSDYKDAWFVGFEPHLSSAVWVGYPNPPIPMTSVHGIEVAGGTFPAMIWHDYMNTAHGSFCQDFSKTGGSFQSSPFFGRYASTGGRRTSGRSGGLGYSGGYRSRGIVPVPRYNPKYYATPPQAAPKVPAPTPAPTKPPSTGGGAPKGNGGGTKGNGK